MSPAPAGTDIVTIAEILGHSKSMVVLIFSRSDPERKRQAVELLTETSAPTDWARSTWMLNSRDLKAKKKSKAEKGKI